MPRNILPSVIVMSHLPRYYGSNEKYEHHRKYAARRYTVFPLTQDLSLRETFLGMTLMDHHLATISIPGFSGFSSKDIGKDPDDYSHDKENTGKNERGTGDHGQHDECLISAGGYHRGNDSSQRKDSVRIHRYCGKGSKAARDHAEDRGEDVFPKPAPGKPVLPCATCQNIEKFDNEHHNEDKACYHKCTSQHIDHFTILSATPGRDYS